MGYSTSHTANSTRVATNVWSFEGSFAPLLPLKVDCLFQTFACLAFHTMPMRTVLDDRVSRLQVLIVRIVKTSLSSVRVVSDVWDFLKRMQRRRKQSAVCAPRSCPSLQGLWTCVTVYWKCIHCVTKNWDQRESEPGSSDQFFETLTV